MISQEALHSVIQVVQKAGDLILHIFDQEDIQVRLKDDRSPVTEADLASHQIFFQELQRITPDIPVVSEEDLSVKDLSQTYWLLDPLDGTKDFIARSTDFAISIALVHQKKPVLGVILHPYSGVYYYASSTLEVLKGIKDQPATLLKKKSRTPSDIISICISPRESSEGYLRRLNPDWQYEFIRKGSCSLKCCLVIEGGADIYIRTGPTGLWDTAAAQCILEQMGGGILDHHMKPLEYDIISSEINPSFIAISDLNFNWQKLWLNN